jgi:hypothetical protein
MYEDEMFMADWHSDPLLNMLAQEGDETEAEQTLSTELAAINLTKPHSGEY